MSRSMSRSSFSHEILVEQNSVFSVVTNADSIYLSNAILHGDWPTDFAQYFSKLVVLYGILSLGTLL
jgi:hypothetical protein